jgi:hypothetical protein
MILPFFPAKFSFSQPVPAIEHAQAAASGPLTFSRACQKLLLIRRNDTLMRVRSRVLLPRADTSAE